MEPRFRADRMDAADRDAFFASGEAAVDHTFATIRRVLRPDFRPLRSLDFGCGVGRLTIPLASRSAEVVGVDVSPTMLQEAEQNCARLGLVNARLVHSDEFWSAPHGASLPFDFVHSFIVFQHIPPMRGLRLTDRILELLAPGGIGALHYTYGRRASILRKTVNRLRRWIPPVNAAVNIVQGKPFFEPQVPMFEYDLEALFDCFERHGCREMHLELTDHGGHLGAMILFVKG